MCLHNPSIVLYATNSVAQDKSVNYRSIRIYKQVARIEILHRRLLWKKSIKVLGMCITALKKVA